MFQRILLVAVLAAALAALGCDSKDSSVEDVMNKANDAVAKAGDAAAELQSAVPNLSQDKITDLAEIAAKFESAPAEAQKLLEEHGWSKEQFDKMLDQVKSNDAARKAFEMAKAKFGESH